nr:urease accessory UreF family protein [Jiella flava]
MFSAAFPIGSFAYSHGIEAAVADGRLRDADAVRDWISVLVSRGSGWNDFVLFAQAYRATRLGDAVALGELAALATALAGSAERRDETLRLGEAYHAAARPWSEAPLLLDDRLPLPIAVGGVAAVVGLPLTDAATAHAHNFVSALVFAAVRLVPLGQSAWVPILRDLGPVITASGARAAEATLDDLGSAALVSDIAAMRHETLGTRLFRS